VGTAPPTNPKKSTAIFAGPLDSNLSGDLIEIFFGQKRRRLQGWVFLLSEYGNPTKTLGTNRRFSFLNRIFFRGSVGLAGTVERDENFGFGKFLDGGVRSKVPFAVGRSSGSAAPFYLKRFPFTRKKNLLARVCWGKNWTGVGKTVAWQKPRRFARRHLNQPRVVRGRF